MAQPNSPIYICQNCSKRENLSAIYQITTGPFLNNIASDICLFLKWLSWSYCNALALVLFSLLFTKRYRVQSLLIFAAGITSQKRLNADVVFLMDASTADSPRYFQSQKDLIKSILRSLGNSADKFRASLVVYSSSTTVLADLSSYTTLQRFEDAVDRATYLRGMGCFAVMCCSVQCCYSDICLINC